jgi:hypothetical protein
LIILFAVGGIRVVHDEPRCNVQAQHAEAADAKRAGIICRQQDE